MAVKIINQEIADSKQSANPGFCGQLKPAITYAKVKYCNNILEQDHRRVKIITDPMKGFKDFDCAVSTISGIEAIAMLRKNQCVVSEFNGRGYYPAPIKNTVIWLGSNIFGGSR